MRRKVFHRVWAGRKNFVAEIANVFLPKPGRKKMAACLADLLACVKAKSMKNAAFARVMFVASVSLKGQRFSTLGFFHKTTPLRALIHGRFAYDLVFAEKIDNIRISAWSMTLLK
jgi:hypothetical protein